MLTDLAYELNSFIDQVRNVIYPWLMFFAALWIVNVANWLTGSRLDILGIYPRHLFGLVGIFFSPILHHDFSHLFFNSIPLFALGLAILARGFPLFIQVTLVVVILGGFLVWLFGRRAIHIGASGVVSGFFGYILITAYTNPSFTTFLLALIIAYYFGSIFLGIFPMEKGISWESHLFGFISGITAAFIPASFWRTIQQAIA